MNNECEKAIEPSQELMKIIISEVKDHTFVIDFSTKKFDINRIGSLMTAISTLLVEVASKCSLKEHREEFLSNLVERIGLETMIINNDLESSDFVTIIKTKFLQ